jgi:hypothetical protein
MRTALFLFGTALLTGTAGAAPEPWATIPASRVSGRLEVLPVPGSFGDSVVTVVGPPRLGGPPVIPRVAVVAIELPREAVESVPHAPERTEDILPPEAIWPGPDGRISMPPDAPDQPGVGANLRNPWEIRIRPRRELAESTFLDGGIIEGGASPVALLNGRVAQKGGSSDGFEVAAVTASAVLLRKSGRSYVIPLGRRVTIETVQP